MINANISIKNKIPMVKPEVHKINLTQYLTTLSKLFYPVFKFFL
jgi:hypothetical protein